MLTLEFLFLFNCMVMMINETASRRDTELRYSTVIQFIDSFIKGLPVNIIPLSFQLTVQLIELVLDSFSFQFELFVIEAMFRLAVDAELYDIRVLIFVSFTFHLVIGCIVNLGYLRASRILSSSFLTLLPLNIIELIAASGLHVTIRTNIHYRLNIHILR